MTEDHHSSGQESRRLGPEPTSEAQEVAAPGDPRSHIGMTAMSRPRPTGRCDATPQWGAEPCGQGAVLNLLGPPNVTFGRVRLRGRRPWPAPALSPTFGREQERN